MSDPRAGHGRTRIVAIVVAAVLVAGTTGCGAARSESGTSSSPVTQTADERTSPGQAPEAKNDGAGVQGYAGAPAPALAPDSPEVGGGSGSDASKIAADQRLVIRDRTVSLRVKDVAFTVRRIRALAAKDSGVVEQVQLASDVDMPIYRPAQDGSSGKPLAGFVTVRVPTARYTAFVEAVGDLGTILSESESAQDVTQQHVDLSARLKNLRAEESRLREFFAKAKNVTEMLAIERELTRVRGEIESMAAQVAFLERQAAMATVTIELTQPEPVASPAGVDWGVRTALTDGVRQMVATFNAIIVSVLGSLPVLVLLGLGAWLVFAIAKRGRVRSEPEDVEPDGEDV